MKLKILIINWQDITNPFGGGAEVHLHEIFKRVYQKGHDVTLLCSKYQNAKHKETVDGIRIIRVGKRNFFNFAVPRVYKQLIKEKNFDVVIDDINKIPFYTPLFVKKPLIGIIHHLFGNSIFIEASLPAALYVNFAERLIPPIYKKIPFTVVSESTKQELLKKGFLEENIHIIHNGVDTLTYKKINTEKNSNPLIGYLGRIKKYKSVDHLLIAFKAVLKEMPDIKLVIMGDGDYLAQIKKLSSSLKVNHAINFTGALDEEKKICYLNKTWFTVNPSPKEGWGLTVIESNACGVPVIAADSPGLRDSVVNGKTGLTYDYGDCNQLTELIIKLINNQQLRQQLSTNSLKWANNFSWDSSAAKMINLIEMIVDSWHSKLQTKIKDETTN